MSLRPLYIVRLALVVLLPLLLTLASARAQTTVYEGVASQLNVDPIPGHTYTWEIYTDAIVDFAVVVNGNCPPASANFAGANTGASVKVNWIKPGIYFYKVTAHDATFCAMNFKVGMIKVLPSVPKAVITGVKITGVCLGVQLNAVKSTGNNPKFEWSTTDPDGTITQTTGLNTEFLLSSNYTGPLPANFKVKLTVTDQLSGKTSDDFITIKVDLRPVAKAFTSGIYENNGTMIADASLSEGIQPNYNWYASGGGDVTGPDNQQKASLYGTGNYTLKVTDFYRCFNEYSFALKFDQIIARRDYARISWAQDTTMIVLSNDKLPDGFVAGPVRIKDLPALGDVVPNADGSVTYKPRNKKPGHDEFVYEICDGVGNCSEATVVIDIYDSPITVPEGFSPNGDGINDVLNFEGLSAYGPSQLSVYNRSGQLVYKSDDYRNDWDGTASNSTTNNKQPVPTSTYYYVLRLGDTNRTLKKFIYIGY